MFGSPTKRYFNKIKKEEVLIGILLENLDKEKEILTRDNITLAIEMNRLKEITNQLEVEYEKGCLLKAEINEMLESLKKENENKVDNDTQNILTTLEKKLYHIKQMAVVKEQSRLALAIISQNNKEIIHNLERVKNVTIEAFHTAMIVAKSLYHQKLVFHKIKTLEKGTGILMEETAKVLKEDGKTMLNETMDTPPEEVLKKAFAKASEIVGVVNHQNKESFPKSETQIIELRKMEDRYE